MKICKLLHINDGNKLEIKNGDYLFVEEFPQSSRIINELLNDGWELRQMISDVTPNLLRDGCYTFFKGGVVLYFEKEVSEQVYDELMKEELYQKKPPYPYNDNDDDDDFYEDDDFDTDAYDEDYEDFEF